MSLKLFLKHCLWQFLLINTCVTIAIGVLGLTLDPTALFGYESYFFPLIFSFLSLIPSFVTYTRRERSFSNVLVRKIVHFLLLEAVLIGFGLGMNLLNSVRETVFFASTVLAVDLIVNGISYHLDQKRADHINQSLKLFQVRD